MLKRTRVAMLLASAMLASLLAGCGGSTPAAPAKPATPPAPTYRDGTFVGTSPADDKGTYGTLELKVEGGKITSAKYAEINGSNGLPKLKENGYTHEAALKAIEELPKSFMKTLDVNKVDAVSGATGTVAKFKEAAKSALALADKNYKPGVLRDGTYKMVSGKDSHGYWAEAAVTVAGGKFDKVEYQEFSAATGKSKKESGYKHEAALKAIEDLPKKLNETKDLAKVDNVTGATSTSKNFKAMVQFALNLAASRDGVYTYKGEKDDKGNWSEATLALNSGKIVAYRYVEYSGKTGKPKAAPDYTHAPALKFLDEVTKQINKNQYGVDFVAGATHSRDEHAKQLRALLDQAIK